MSVGRTPMIILSLLRVGPMTGYQIRETCRTRFAHFWAESSGQIYPALKALAGDGRIRQVAGDGRGKSYEITAAGVDHLRGWLVKPAAARLVRDELFLKILCGGLAGHDVQRGHLRRARDAMEARLASARQGLRDLEEFRDFIPDPDYWFLVARAGELVAEAMLRWCDEADAVLATKGNDDD